tara:strand:- start:5770 stop:6348 length:579 start_codon:yes stop_codon:yes gene_type:complete
MKNFLRLVIGVQFQRAKHIEDLEQVIIVANHNSHLDTMILLSALPSKILHKVHPIAAGDYFNKNKVVGFLTRFFVNTLYVNRETKVKGENLDFLDKVIKEGKSIIIFPEGSRGSPDELQQFRKGVGVILSKNPDVPFVPMFLDGVGRAMPKGEALPVPFTTKLFVGKPVYTHNMNVDQINELIYTKIIELKY